MVAYSPVLGQNIMAAKTCVRRGLQKQEKEKIG
jgi:hypothetical protein